MTEPAYFFDTFALVERERGSEAYERFASLPIVTHQMNLLEFIAYLARSYGEGEARVSVRMLNPNLVEADLDDLFAAARFRRRHARKNVSYVDALGYVLADRHRLRFLTGDRAFKGLANVEFVA
ncbi:MAG: type II toxin-antitoxin system VapC family toxin [Thermoplasmatota archaeon]